jgi:DNA-binding XRE family transcriptional regulator
LKKDMCPSDERTEVLNADLDRVRRPRNIKPTLQRRPDGSLGCLVSQLAAGRVHAGLSQQEVATRMGTTASAISRLESGKYSRPTLTTIENYALVVGCELTIAVRMPRGWEDVYHDPE